MRTIVYTISMFMSLVAISVNAQNILTGKITDRLTNEPLLNAAVYIPELKQGAVSGFDGNFRIDHLPAGKFLVEIKYLGFSTQTKIINISGNTTIDFSLMPSVTEMKEVVITGVGRISEIGQSPVQIKPINKEYLNQSGATNIIDAISGKPGISQITTGQAVSKPIIRGLGFNRIITLNNGIRQEGQQWGDEHGIEIDEYAVERVEIVKGPGSLLYGSDGIAGVVNFISPNPLPKGRIIGAVTTNYQSNNNLLGTSVMNAGNKNGINWLVRVTGKKAGNYSNAYDGVVYNSGFNEWDANGELGLIRSWGYSHFNISSFNQTLALTEGERDSLGNFIKLAVVNNSVEELPVTDNDLKGYRLDIPRQEINHFRIASNNTIILGTSSLGVDVAYQQNQRKEFANPLDKDEEELFFFLNTYNYNLKYFFKELNEWEIITGINGMFQDNTNKGEEVLVPDYNLADAGIFFLGKKSFNHWHFSGGLRFDNRAIKADRLIINSENEAMVKFSGFNENYSGFSGSAGVSHTINEKNLVKFNLSRGFRAPNIAELGSNGKHEGTVRYEYGDSSLKPEYSTEVDASWSYQSDHTVLEITPFYNSISNFIFTEKLNSVSGGDSIPDPSDPASAFQYRQGNARLYGGEFSLDIHPHPLDWLHFENSFSYVRGIQSNQPDSTRNLPFMPQPKTQTEFRVQLKKPGKWLANLYFRMQLEYNFAQNKFFAAFGTETGTPSYALVHGGIGSDIVNKDGKTMFSVYIQVNNLMDKTYQSHLSRLKYAPENLPTGRTGIFNMGRNISVRVIVPLTFSKI